MTNLPWLVQASGPGPAQRRARRTEEASRDLAALADRIRPRGLHLLIEDAVDIVFEFAARATCPPGTIDARGRDALGIVLDDPTALLITADGFYIGLQSPPTLVGVSSKRSAVPGAGLAATRSRVGTTGSSSMDRRLTGSATGSGRSSSLSKPSWSTTTDRSRGSNVRRWRTWSIEAARRSGVVRSSRRFAGPSGFRCRSCRTSIPPRSWLDSSRMRVASRPPALVLNGERWRSRREPTRGHHVTTGRRYFASDPCGTGGRRID